MLGDVGRTYPTLLFVKPFAEELIVIADWSHFKFKDVKKKLQSCITWTKTSVKGAKTWKQSCVTAGLVPKSLQTPLKKRFGSILLMLKRILEYREAVTICYGQSSQVGLQVRNPSVTEWLVAQRVFECLMPIMDTCILNQATESWLLSDTISSCVTLTAKTEQNIARCYSFRWDCGTGNFQLRTWNVPS